MKGKTFSFLGDLSSAPNEYLSLPFSWIGRIELIYFLCNFFSYLATMDGLLLEAVFGFFLEDFLLVFEAITTILKSANMN